MAGSGKRPVEQSHYDEITLQEYSLGQLLPEENETIRAHLADCAACRAKAEAVAALGRRLRDDLHGALDAAAPSPKLNFDAIQDEWHRPPRRTSLGYRVQEIVPAGPAGLLLVLLAIAFLLFVPSSGTVALRSLELPGDYDGPPAMVAASTDYGLVLIHLSDKGVKPIMRLSYLTRPQRIAFSPDGRWLAVGQGSTLHVIDTHDETAHARIDLTDGAGWNWSPNGAQLAYTDGTGQLTLFDADTQSSRALIPADESAQGVPIWTGDGSAIAYATGDSLWRLDPATGYRSELVRNPAPDTMLLIPAAWSTDASVLLAWDQVAAARGTSPALYRVDVVAHRLEQIPGSTLAQGDNLAWPLSAQERVLTAQDNRLVLVNVVSGQQQTVPTQIPRPAALDWAPNGSWAATIVAGAPVGERLYLYAPQDGELRPIKLPGGAEEQAVIWAGAEHLFVIRQTQGGASELWSVPLTSGDNPQRILTNARQPESGTLGGWQWGNVLAVQSLPAS
ncbi:zf-HC2 domain-containing protein [Aggregatilinea lenta]|uniref:zf-HC2 domain-containing protein n=1 Tax=Aggregatilinea lenta TaxID=913108 RepID=UPI0013C2BFF2|nr:zf-HC2 domain-containing protein [Aggregatilinea lenta]